MQRKKNIDRRYSCIATPCRSMYGPLVKIGNWFEDRCEYVYQPQPRCTTYLTDFTNPQLFLSDQAIWNQKIKSQGNGQDILMFDHQRFIDNYTTLYDLMYRHFKKGLTGPLLKKDRISSIESFGNITSVGLKNCLEMKWRCDQSKFNESEYGGKFTLPEPEAYKQIRLAKRSSDVTSSTGCKSNNKLYK